MLVTPLLLIEIFSKRMLVDWPKCEFDPRDEGHLACLVLGTLSSKKMGVGENLGLRLLWSGSYSGLYQGKICTCPGNNDMDNSFCTYTS